MFALDPQIPAKTLPEFVAWMKAHPDDAKVATSGRGSAQEMAAEMFRMASGTKMLLIPDKGSSAAQPDPIGGRTALYIDTISAIAKLEAAGIEIQGGPPRDYAELIKSDLAKWGKVVRGSGIPAE